MFKRGSWGRCVKFVRMGATLVRGSVVHTLSKEILSIVTLINWCKFLIRGLH